MNNKQAWHSVDIVFSLVLIAVSVFVIVESLRTSLPMVAADQATLLDMPGLSPVICAVLLVCMSTGMIISAFRKGGRLGGVASGQTMRALSGKEALTVYKVFALLGVYVFWLWPHLPFWLSTSVFLTGFMAVFGVFSKTSVLVACTTAGVLWYVFLELFNIPLPARFVFGG